MDKREIMNNKIDAIKILILKRIMPSASISLEYPEKLRLKKLMISVECPM
jgi:hypothetical protein